MHQTLQLRHREFSNNLRINHPRDWLASSGYIKALALRINSKYHVGFDADAFRVKHNMRTK